MFHDLASYELYTLSLHDALPICLRRGAGGGEGECDGAQRRARSTTARPNAEKALRSGDRKSTRLNSSYANTSYGVFCVKKKTGANSRANVASRDPSDTDMRSAAS